MVKIRKLNPFQRLNAVAEIISDKASEWFGSPLSIVLHMIFWFSWIVTAGWGEDRFPFGELTLVLSLEAIFLSMLILNSSSRQQAKDSYKIHEGVDISEEVRSDVKNLHDDIEEILELLDTEPENDKF